MQGPIEFKFTQGAWDSAEQDAAGAETPNRQFVAPSTGAATYSGAVLAWQTPATSIASLQQKLAQLLADTHTPGMAVAIVTRAGPQWVAGLGLADVASGRSANADTLFRIGSTSKAFAAMAVLELVNQGKLSLQTPVQQLVPELGFDNPWEATDPVRVVDLLEHTTGWDDWAISAYALDDPNSTLADGLRITRASRASRWRPGTRVAYCNTGPAVAALIVEKLSGVRFEDYVAQHFFAPIGMHTASYWAPPVQQAATLYHEDGQTPYRYSNLILRPAGSINASAKDMAAYLSFYLQRGTVNGKALLPQATLQRMERPTRNLGAQQGLAIGYGLYDWAMQRDGWLVNGHDGALSGAHTTLNYLAEQGIGYFISINSQDGGVLRKADSMVWLYLTRDLAKPVPPAVAAMPAAAADYVGWYDMVSPRNETLRYLTQPLQMGLVSVDHNKLTLAPLGISAKAAVWVPSSGLLFRGETEPLASLALIPPSADGRFVVDARFVGMTYQQIPDWLAWLRLSLVAYVALTVLSILFYAPVWSLRSIKASWRRPNELPLKVWPLAALLSLLLAYGLLGVALHDPIELLGRPTWVSVGHFVCSIAFALATVGSVAALWQVRQRRATRPVSSWVYAHAVAATLGLVIVLAYLAYGGAIGWRTWV